jgi:hypothetical protein
MTVAGSSRSASNAKTVVTYLVKLRRHGVTQGIYDSHGRRDDGVMTIVTRLHLSSLSSGQSTIFLAFYSFDNWS